MSRREFAKQTKREALSRSGGRCEATGPEFGFDDGARCQTDLGSGVHFDHIWPASEGGDASLENCQALCPSCHRWKTSRRDAGVIAKIRRVRNKHTGVAKGRSRLSHPTLKRKVNGSVVPR